MIRCTLPVLAALLAFVPAPSAFAALQISEFMADNADALTDEDGDYSDWIEVHNPDAAAVNLLGWRLTDSAAQPNKWVFPSLNLAPGARLLIFASNKNRRDAAHELHTNFQLSKNGEYLGLLRPDGGVEHQFTPAYPPQYEDVSYGYGVVTSDATLIQGYQQGVAAEPGAPCRWRVPTANTNDVLIGGQPNPVAANVWIGTAFDDSTWTAGGGGVGYERATSGILYTTHFQSDTNALMYNLRATVYIRVPFTVANPASVVGLKLRMKYDDGFAVYLNGNPTMAAAANAPAVLDWASVGTATHDDAAAILYADFTLPQSALTSLVAGNNVLCIHGLNSPAGSSDFLITPMLIATTTSGAPLLGYMSTPTPGGFNIGADANPGPLVKNVPKTLPPPPVAQSGAAVEVTLPITAEVLPTVNPVASVELKWRIMFNVEQTQPMFDDGLHGDGAANDKVYGATIATTALLRGQMIRWRVVAADSTSEAGKSPPFAPVDDSPEYWGTVANDDRPDTSQLPVIYTFISNIAGADDVGGARASVSFLGEFYDNIYINRHGQSTGGFVKKSYNLDFNRDNRFRYDPAAKRVKDIDLLTNWGDKSKVRNALGWETMRITGSKGHFAFPVRVERNGTFFAVTDMVEDGDDRYLERVGLNPEGALYKMYNTLDSATANVEKKTRTWENNNDLQALINGLNPATAIATRRIYGYDNVDLPILVNNLAALALINSQDQGHKNYYLYKDPGLQNDWKLLAWDMDLSFGHTWTSSQNYFDDDLDSQRNMQNGATNRLKSLLYDSPELNKAWMRRMRTLMDQYLVSATSTTGYFETRIAQIMDQIDPPGLPASTSDAFLDFQRWGFWTDGNGGGTIAWNNAAGVNHTMRASAQRILTANPSPTYPSAALYSGYDAPNNRSTVPAFFPGRRAYLYNDPSRPAGSPNNLSGSEPLPAAQLAAPPVTIASVNYDPGIGDQEYLVIRNSSLTLAVDISDWTLSGGVTFTFPGGTVIPPGAGTTQHMGDLFVTRSPRDFRLRTVSPKAGEYCFILGPYEGRLSARGETVELRNAANALVSSNTWPPAPTAGQTALRVSEIHFNPLNPSPAELASNPSWTAADFEFMEFQNTGASPLDLSGARLDDAVTFTFPALAPLAPGARILVVANLAAFSLRYNTAGLTVAGEWVGNLDNNGEQLKVYDSRGEEILEFSYGDWYSPTDGDGYSLVFLNPSATPYTDWGLRPNWSISATTGGTPGAADTSYSMGYDLWENTAFPTLTGAANMRSADPDLDGLLNLVEYAVNSNPLDGKQANLPQASVVTVAGENHYALSFRRWKNAVDITYGPEISTDAQTWFPLTTPHGPVVDHGDGTETVTFRAGTPRTAREFVRLRVTEL